jgi:hypothetical protein
MEPWNFYFPSLAAILHWTKLDSTGKKVRACGPSLASKSDVKVACD